jgi:hypothetical protein
MAQDGPGFQQLIWRVMTTGGHTIHLHNVGGAPAINNDLHPRGRAVVNVERLAGDEARHEPCRHDLLVQ